MIVSPDLTPLLEFGERRRGTRVIVARAYDCVIPYLSTYYVFSKSIFLVNPLVSINFLKICFISRIKEFVA